MVLNKGCNNADLHTTQYQLKGGIKMPETIKEIICRYRIRHIIGGFCWVDHRLVRDRYIERCSSTALAVYLFLITVAEVITDEGLRFILRRNPLRAQQVQSTRENKLRFVRKRFTKKIQYLQDHSRAHPKTAK